MISSKVFKNTLKVIIFFLFLTTMVFAWDEPTQIPTDGNVSTPINVSDNLQKKKGELWINIEGEDDSTGFVVENGKAGIGVTSPEAKLDVDGDIRLSDVSSSQAGTIYYDSTNKKFMCNVDGTEENCFPGTAQSGSMPGLFWSLNSDNNTLHPSEDNWNVGIGTNGSSAKLHVKGSFLAEGGDDGNFATKINGTAQSLMVWLPSKKAFRSGYHHNWQYADIGNYSLAFGLSTKASGQNSVAMGELTQAIGEGSVAMGYKTIANKNYAVAMGKETISDGDSSVAMGGNTLAQGNYSVAMGEITQAIGEASIAMGSETISMGNYSVAMGKLTQAIGRSSVAMGKLTQAIGENSIAMGESTQAQGNYSIAMGRLTQAIGEASVAMGESTQAQGNYSIAMGKNTTAAAEASVAFGLDYINNIPNSLGVGHGMNEILLNPDGDSWFMNAGNVGIGTDMPMTKLHVIGDTTTQGLDVNGELCLNSQCIVDWTEISMLPSSIKYKKNIRPIESALEKTKQLQGVYFDWKKDNTTDIGLIAEEVDKIIPEAVYRKDGEIEGLYYEKLVPVLIEAVKEQDKQIQELKQRDREIQLLIDQL